MFGFISLALVTATTWVVLERPAPSPPERTLATAFKQLTKNTVWQEEAVIPVGFDTHHPQGFARVGDHLFLSSVEILERTKPYAQQQNGLDRTAGKGKGHLFKMDVDGNLLAHIELGEGAMYHPGGIDFDGTHIWVPVAEYRPNSTSIIYRVDPASMQATEVFRYPDHIGGLVHNQEEGTLHGVSWGSRRFYAWLVDDALRVTNADVLPEQLQTLNPAHYIDYQDCQYVDVGQALCGGLSHYQRVAGRPSFALGGIELLDLREGHPLHQVPVALWTDEGLPMTQNPVALEATNEGLRAYFMPEDNQSRLFIYEVVVD